jgi:F5/8 type C domain
MMIRYVLAACLLLLLVLAGVVVSQDVRPKPRVPGGTPDPASALIPQPEMRIAYVDSQESVSGVGAAKNLLDGNLKTVWHTRYAPAPPDALPHTVVLDLGGIYNVDGFKYTPRQDGMLNGTVVSYFLHVALEFPAGMAEEAWDLVAGGNWPATAAAKTTRFAPHKARYVRFQALREAGGKEWSSGAELNVWGVLVEKLPTVWLSWTAAAAPVGAQHTGYLLYRRPGPCATPSGDEVLVTRTPLPADQDSYTDHESTPGTQCYRIRGVYTCPPEGCAGDAAAVQADVQSVQP